MTVWLKYRLFYGARLGNNTKTAGYNAAIRVLSAAVVGGTMSEMTGGKFANGAYSAAFAAALSVGMEQSGLSASTDGTAGEFTTETPEELAALRKAHPELVEMENKIWEDSQSTGLGGLFGIGEPAREQSLMVYQSKTDGSLQFDLQYKAVKDPVSGLYSRINLPRNLPVPKGYNLIIVEHTHPFPYCFACQRGGIGRGPSPADMATAGQYSGAFHVIQAQPPANFPREFQYYGARSR